MYHVLIHLTCLPEFKMYSENSNHTNKNTWLGELCRCLSGELKGAFEAMHGPNDKYGHLKEKLSQ